jgi:sugar phosphate isomerase/epimerase
MWKICLGINGWESGKNDMGIYKYNDPIELILDHAVEMKYDGVEIINLSIDPFPSNLRDINEINKFKKKYFSRNLKIAGVHAKIPRSGANSDEGKRMLCAKAIVDNVIFAKELGADYLAIWPDAKQVDINDWVVAQRMLDTLGKTFNLLQEENINLENLDIVEETEPVECFCNLNIAKTVVNEINNPNFKLLFDTAQINLMSNGGYIRAIKEFKGKIGHIHLADNDGTRWNSSKSGMSSKHLIIGEGDINIMEILGALKDANYKGWIQIDCWQNPNPFRCSEVNKKVVDAIIRDLQEGVCEL